MLPELIHGILIARQCREGQILHPTGILQTHFPYSHRPVGDHQWGPWAPPGTEIYARNTPVGLIYWLLGLNLRVIYGLHGIDLGLIYGLRGLALGLIYGLRGLDLGLIYGFRGLDLGLIYGLRGLDLGLIYGLCGLDLNGITTQRGFNKAKSWFRRIVQSIFCTPEAFSGRRRSIHTAGSAIIDFLSSIGIIY